MLQAIQTYIAQRGTVSLQDLALHFHTQPDVIQPMLNRLRHRGRLQLLSNSGRCHGCTHCQPESLELYRLTAESNGAMADATRPTISNASHSCSSGCQT